VSSPGQYRYELTPSGYDLWDRLEDGKIGQRHIPTDGKSQPDPPLRSIPDDPVPDPEPNTQGEQTTNDSAPATDEGIINRHQATIEHQEVLSSLRKRLLASGYEVRKTQYSDLIAYKNSRPEVLLFEVKSITPQNIWDQLRKAVGQVVEYEYTDVITRDSLPEDVQPGICLSQPPTTEIRGYLDHLDSHRGLTIVWWSNEQQGFESLSDQPGIEEIL
jgi:hypothetical protein